MYVMESHAETRRLLAQQMAGDVRGPLLAAGLRPGLSVLDAGCGPGAIAMIIAEIVGPAGSVTGIDGNEERVLESRRRSSGCGNIRFQCGDVREIDSPDGVFDFVWSQFVLEYLSDRRRALTEFVRVTRPGGKIVVSEIDGIGFCNWPFPESLRRGTERLAEALAETGFDVHVGRKLFSEFRQAGLVDVRVHLFPQYVIAGRADDRTLEDWSIRFQALEPRAVPAFGGVVAFREYCAEYMRMLADPDALKYAVLLVTEGTRA